MSDSVAPKSSILAPARLCAKPAEGAPATSRVTQFKGFKESKLSESIAKKKEDPKSEGDEAEARCKADEPATSSEQIPAAATPEVKKACSNTEDPKAISAFMPLAPTASAASTPSASLAAPPVPEERVKTPIQSENEASGFIFGENLSDRAKNFSSFALEGADSKPSDLTSTASATAVSFTSSGKTLTESAAEYSEAHAQKRKFSEIQTVTGEEDEKNVLQMSAKLYVFEKRTSSWLEKGQGNLRLNDVDRSASVDDKEDKEDLDDEALQKGSRLVMRTSGTLRVIFNTWLFPGMSIENPSDHTVRLTGMEEGQMKVFLIKGSSKDAKELFSALNSRLKSKNDNSSEEPKVKKPSFDVPA